MAWCEETRTVGEKTTVEHRYNLNSSAGDAQRFGQAVRGHWGIKNRLHWVLDVVFQEEQSQLRRDPAAENFAVFRHLALSLLRQERSGHTGIKAKRLKAGWDNASLTTVLFV